MSSTTIQAKIQKVISGSLSDVDDLLASEEPLEVRMQYGLPDARVTKNISVTMRTPGNDKELATGFLFTEGIIKKYQYIKQVFQLRENIIQVILQENINLDLSKLERNFYTTSSCGVCGKSSIDAVKQVCENFEPVTLAPIPASLIYTLPDLLRSSQDVFEHTGGLHASALFNTNGQLLLTREDVGRHNALDKLIGVALEKDMIPLNNHLLLLSGRASFELIQKAAMAGINFVAAVGAPSSLAVEMAKEHNMTLIGFLRGEKFNIYNGAERIIM
jgi:FdhD protein